MSEGNRGLLELIPPPLLGYLLSFLPQNDPLAENVPGGLLTPEFVQQLRGELFCGYALAKFASGERAWLAFYRGRLLEAWRQRPQGHVVGTEAYRALRAEFAQASLSLYRLPPDGLPPVVALTQGSPRMVGMAAPSVAIADLTLSLQREQFTGALVLEDASVGRGWYFVRGKRIFGGDLPESFRAGRLHLVQATAKAPPDLLEQTRAEELARRQNRLEAVWAAAAEVLREYMGRGATPALERLRKAQPEGEPAALEAALRRWMEQSLEPNAAAMFDRLLRPGL